MPSSIDTILDDYDKTKVLVSIALKDADLFEKQGYKVAENAHRDIAKRLITEAILACVGEDEEVTYLPNKRLTYEGGIAFDRNQLRQEIRSAIKEIMK